MGKIGKGSAADTVTPAGDPPWPVLRSSPELAYPMI